MLTSRFAVYSDERLVELFQSGDEQAFDDLFDRYKNKLFNFVYRFVEDKECAMDLVQETFLSVYTSLYRWQPKAKFSTWLYTIAINKARTEIKKAQRRARQIALETELPLGDVVEIQLPSSDKNPVDVYDDNMLVSTFNDAVKNLPEQQRKVFVLRHSNDLRLAEIADILDIKEGSVKAHLFKAVANVKKFFKKAGVSVDTAYMGDANEE